MVDILYPENWDKMAACPTKVEPEDVAVIEERARVKIRAAVPRDGKPLPVGELVRIVRANEDGGCYTLPNERIIQLIDEVAKERPPESQVPYKGAKAVSEEPLDVGEVGEIERIR